MNWISDNFVSIVALVISATIGFFQLRNWRKDYRLRQRIHSETGRPTSSSMAYDEARAQGELVRTYREEVERLQADVEELEACKQETERLRARVTHLEEWRTRAEAQQKENVSTIRSLRKVLSDLQVENQKLREQLAGGTSGG